MYALWAEQYAKLTPWDRVHLFWSDERYVAQVDLAQAYEADLRKFFSSQPPEFDVQLLGLGVEGHTASLFPNSPALDEKKKWVMAVRGPIVPERLTFTPVVLNRERSTFFLASGEDKREILHEISSEPDSQPSKFPAARIQPPGRLLWFLDQAAAG